MTQILIGRELPNLKITLGNDDSDENIEEGEIFENEETSAPSNDKPHNKNENIEVVRAWVDSLHHPKVYENKRGAFVTGLDLSSEVLIKKLEERAARFGLEGTPKNQITQYEIDELYKSLGVDDENAKSSKIKNVRLDALHLRGVEEMSTNDVFHYFNEYGPASVEWINDFSCNVVWLEDASAARALLGLSKPLVLKKKNENSEEITSPKNKNDPGVETINVIENNENEAVILISDESSDDDDETDAMPRYNKNISNKESNDITPMEIENNTSNKESFESSNELSTPVDVPIPPGIWRLGIPHPKAKALLLRFATKDDKKLPGAEKRSHYYQKYGNPNYGGLKGLISSSRKRKIQATRNKIMVGKLTGNKTIEDAHDEIDFDVTWDIKNTNLKPNRIKQPRMRMYADDEEEKQKRISNRHPDTSNRQRSILDRLGNKFTREQLWQIGNKSLSSEDDADIPKASFERKVTSRYNVWTNLAHTMAEEEAEIKKPRLYSKDLRETIRSSRNTIRSSVQYRKSFKSRPKVQNDLRSKISKLRKEDSKSKHRSPLCLPDKDSSSESDME